MSHNFAHGAQIGPVEISICWVRCFSQLNLHSFILGFLLGRGDQGSGSYRALGSLLPLQRAIDEKFSTLEEKEKELRQLRLAVRERDLDLERLRGILSSNEATMQVGAQSALIRHPSPTAFLKHQPCYHFPAYLFMRRKYIRTTKNNSHSFHHQGLGSEKFKHFYEF